MANIGYVYINYIDADGELHQLPAYAYGDNTDYFSGQTGHSITYRKKDSSSISGYRDYMVSLVKDGGGRLHVRLSDGDYTARSLTPKTATETINADLTAGGKSQLYYYRWCSGISGSTLRTHGFTCTWTSIVYKDNWNVTHNADNTSSSTGEYTKVTTGYHCMNMSSANVQFTFRRSAQDYSYVTYKLSGGWSFPDNWTGTTGTKYVSGNKLYMPGITINWSVNTAKEEP